MAWQNNFMAYLEEAETIAFGGSVCISEIVCLASGKVFGKSTWPDMQLHGDIRVSGRAKSLPPQGVAFLFKTRVPAKKKKTKNKKKQLTILESCQRSERPIGLTDKTYLLYRGYKSWCNWKRVIKLLHC